MPPLPDQEIPDGEDEEALQDDGEGPGPEADESGEGDASGDENPEQDGGAEEVEEPKGRATKAVLAAKKAAKEAEERAQAAARERDELRRQIEDSKKPKQETEDEERARVALMSHEEQVNYRLEKMERAAAQEKQQQQYQNWDTNDKSDFKTFCVANKIAASYAEKVEKEVPLLRAQGHHFGRRAIAAFLIGKDAMENGADKVKTAKVAGQAALKKQQVKPASGRSDQQTQRGSLSEREARRKRLENAVF